MVKKGSQLENVYVGELTVLDRREGWESCNLGLGVLVGVGDSQGRTRLGSLQKHHGGYSCLSLSSSVAVPAPQALQNCLGTLTFGHLHICASLNTEQSEQQGRGGKEIIPKHGVLLGDPSLAPLASIRNQLLGITVANPAQLR